MPHGPDTLKHEWLVYTMLLDMHDKDRTDIYKHDVEAMFHNIADVLEVDVFTSTDLKSSIEGIFYRKSTANNNWDVKKWLEPFIVGSHSFNNCFHIHVHFNKEDMPRPVPLTWNSELGFSEDMPRPVPPTWNSELVRQLEKSNSKWASTAEEQ
ncbi:unnamed protein product [Mytilus edulis]|uniref:Uncharacterized protein n=1 Tax=Mytilus edulis TaxID=6550 RepID=A0A8S3TWK0_MYTED|nr:unnamed protein product [Mytilus edulis]